MTLPVDILSFYHYKEPIRLYIKSIAVELKIWRTYLCHLAYLDAWLECRYQNSTTVGTEIMLFS